MDFDGVIGFVGVFVLATLLSAWRGSDRLFGAGGACVARLARRRAVAVTGVGVLSLALYSLPTILYHTPVPIIHDEFSYWLAGDTFARGRLTNPTPPMWTHFEAIHTLLVPTYASKFPPGPGLMLALGFLVGLPIAGVWLGTAIAVSCLCWMLLAWLPPRWAVLTTLLAALHPTTVWFSQIYWGGGVAVAGGALAAGACARLCGLDARSRASSSTDRARWGALFGLGLAVLAISRPFEGLLACVFLGTWMLLVVGRGCREWRRWGGAAVSCASVLLLAGSWIAYYNWRVTGDPLVLPYAAHAREYMAAPLFFGQTPPSVPSYRHEILRRFHVEGERVEYRRQLGGWTAWIAGVREKAALLGGSYLRPATMAPILFVALLAGLRSRRMWIAVAGTLALPAVHVMLTPWMRIAYLAPVLGFFFAWTGMGLHALSRWRPRGTSVGRTLVRAAVVTQIVAAVHYARESAVLNARDPLAERAGLIDLLRREPGKDLIFVRYGPDHPPALEVLFNDADFASAEVIFARPISASADLELRKAFGDRRAWVWNLDPASSAAGLVPLDRRP